MRETRTAGAAIINVAQYGASVSFGFECATELHMVGVSRTPVVRIRPKSHEGGGLRPRHVIQYLEERNVNGDRDGKVHVTHFTPALAALMCVLFGCRARHATTCPPSCSRLGANVTASEYEISSKAIVVGNRGCAGTVAVKLRRHASRHRLLRSQEHMQPGT